MKQAILDLRTVGRAQRSDDSRPQHRGARRDGEALRGLGLHARSKALSPSEELSLIVVPSEIGSAFDMRCLVYKNSALNQVSFQCPDATQAQLGQLVETP